MRVVTSSIRAVGIALMLIASLACSQEQASEAGEGEAIAASTDNVAAQVSVQDQIQRGRYLVMAGGCNDCHTPWVFDEALGMPRPDMSRMLSGHPKGGPDPEGTVGAHDIGLIGPTFTSFALPFGVMYSANLTPDVDTGIGSWTEEMFLDIFRKGRHLGGDGRGVLPPMPWLWIRNMTDDDFKAVYAYLHSIPPISNAVPEHKIPEEVIWKLRDSMDQLAKELPQEEWAARKD